MKCKYPEFVNRKKSHALRPCGQCMPCRISDRRVKTHRLLLESYLWPHNSFVTLTFSDDNLPLDCGVSVSEHQCFMKNLREQWRIATGQLFRFYGVGEYGEKTFRPHYHYILFNFPSCVGSGPAWHGNTFIPCHCRICSFVTRVWGKGHVFIGTATTESMQYVAGYVTKKMTAKDDPRLIRDDGIIWNPEFSKCSLRPGIASGAVADLVDKFNASAMDELPVTLNHNGRHLPLGRYLKGKMREAVNEGPTTTTRMEVSQMHYMLARAKNDTLHPSFIAGSSLAIALQLINRQEVLQIEQRYSRSKGSSHEI